MEVFKIFTIEQVVLLFFLFILSTTNSKSTIHNNLMQLIISRDYFYAKINILHDQRATQTTLRTTTASPSGKPRHLVALPRPEDILGHSIGTLISQVYYLILGLMQSYLKSRGFHLRERFEI